MTALSAWREAFEQAVNTSPNVSAVQAARQRAFARFEAHGIPHRRHEYWKYTPVNTLMPETVVASSNEDVFTSIDAFRLVFVDGVLNTARSDLDALAQEITIGNAQSDWVSTQIAILQEAHTKVARPLADLNLAMAEDCLALRIPQGVSLSKPIHLRYEGKKAAHIQLLVSVENGAEATLLESGNAALTTAAEINVQSGGILRHLRAQNEVKDQQFTHIFAQVAQESSFQSFTLCMDSTLARNETIVTIHGDDANAHIAAAVLGRDKAHIDNTVYVSHESENCESRQVIKTVLDEQAKNVFQGKIFVAEGAQKTDGYQISQSVMLSETAQTSSKPELEIYADDVKCSHGSTSGALDEDALFYLRARGVPRKTAEGMLVTAFVEEALEEINDPNLQEPIRMAVAGWMARREAV